MEDNIVHFDKDTPKIAQANKVRSLLAVNGDDDTIGSVEFDLLVLEAGKNVGDAVKIDGLVLPTLGAVNKKTTVRGGATGKAFTYTDPETSQVTTLEIGVNMVADLFWDGELKTWSKVAEEELPVAYANGIIESGNSYPVSGNEVFGKTALKKHGKNHINAAALKDGFYVNEYTGALSENPNYKSTEEFIKVLPDVAYIFNNILRYAYYSAPNEGSFLSGHVEDIQAPTSKVIPTEANFIRLSVNHDYNLMYLGLTSEFSGFQPYENLLQEDVKAQAVTKELKEEILLPAAKIVKTYGKNRIDHSAVIQGKYVNAFSGKLNDNAGYKATGFIYVGDLINYTISPNIIHIAKYASADEDTYITGEEYPVSSSVTRGSEQYVRLSFYSTTGNMQLESGSTATGFESFTEIIQVKDNENTIVIPQYSDDSQNTVLVPAPAKIYLAPSLQYNIYFKNAFIGDFGYNDLKVFDMTADKGVFMSKKFRIVPVSGEDSTVTLRALEHGQQKAEKSISLKTANNSSGAGLTRKVLFLGDSTINQEVIVDSFKEYFDSDVMNVNLIGTRQTMIGTKHEGRSGWTIDDYYQINGRDGVSNPFFSAATGKFDFSHYMVSTGQSMTSNDWFIVQLGINDLYALAYLKDKSEAEARVSDMIFKLNYIIASIRAYNSEIRIGISMTIPPSTEQDATALLLNSGYYNKEAYEKIGLKEWWKRLLEEYDLRTLEKIHLVASNLMLDTENNFKTTIQNIDSHNTAQISVQNDDVHPSVAGYKQIADGYVGIIKYFG